VPSQEKKEKVKQIGKWFDKTDNLLVLHYKGLTVAEANQLRADLNGMGSELRVLKNTLTRIAGTDTPKEEIKPLLDGPVGVVFVHEDAARVAKALKDFAKGRKEFYLTGGMLEGRMLDGKRVEAFAVLPSREVLLAQMVGMMQAPLARLVGTVVAPARKMLGLFQALADKKSAEGPSAEAATSAEPEKAEEPSAVEPEAEVKAQEPDAPAASAEPEKAEEPVAVEPEAEVKAQEPEAPAAEAEQDQPETADSADDAAGGTGDQE
jgi:large subunit ribosomal protein L10